MDDRLRQLGPRQRNGEPVGMYSVCSSHPMVLETAVEQAKADGSELLIEATCNQVNPFGGYAVMTPAEFVRYIRKLSDRIGFPHEKLLIGGDHLGPFVWRNEPAESAMAKAAILVSDCVAAGYGKIHLDAGMPLGDDPGGEIAMDLSARRSVLLCKAAEAARTGPQREAHWPVYVIGAEAPVPGGSLVDADRVTVTRPHEIRDFLEVCRRYFHEAGLDDAWQRVIAVVVQPGIDFGETAFAPYNREKARALSMFHDRLPHGMTYEIHGTDFQPPEALSRLVEDHFSLLKTGPVLTFAFREAVFALAGIETEWLSGKKGVSLSEIRAVIDEDMRRVPDFWKSHYSGDEPEVSWRRAFSYLDRIRYYWPRPAVEAACSQLLSNLNRPIPLPLVSQFLPDAYPAVAAGEVPAEPLSLIRHRISAAILPYVRACRMNEQLD